MLFLIPDMHSSQKVTVWFLCVHGSGEAGGEAGVRANGLTATWVVLATSWAWGPCWRQATQPL